VLGGDFYDVVECADGHVFALIGDVAGHGPDEAALGVCLRIAWRTLVLGGHDPDSVLRTLQVVHDHERHARWVFTTLCMATIAPDRASISLRLAGHPAPLLASAAGIAPLDGLPADPPLGVVDGVSWRAREHALPERWSLLLFTDGLIEGRIGAGPARLGQEGLVAMVKGALDTRREDPAALVATLVERAEDLNGGPLLDDVAAFVVQRR
jgi:serine phosphatase RsbU (regulator of sigma subunit)